MEKIKQEMLKVEKDLQHFFKELKVWEANIKIFNGMTDIAHKAFKKGKIDNEELRVLIHGEDSPVRKYACY